MDGNGEEFQSHFPAGEAGAEWQPLELHSARAQQFSEEAVWKGNLSTLLLFIIIGLSYLQKNMSKQSFQWKTPTKSQVERANANVIIVM